MSKLLKLSPVIVVMGLLFASYGLAMPDDDDLSVLSRLGHLGPARMQAELSEDRVTLYNAGLPVVYVANPDPSHEPARIQPPIDLLTAPETATSSFSITYAPNGGTDPWGEPCYTFPAQAQASFSAAASIWANIIQSSVPITIRACWANLGSSNILGYSGGAQLYRDFPGAPRPLTWYSESLANALAGSDLDLSSFDMHITYNSNFTWYYGTDGLTPAGQYDLMSVVLHEIAHGLNFSGSMSYSAGSGSWGYGTGYPNIYDTFTRDGSGNDLINTAIYSNPSTALGSALTSNNIWFHGSNAMAANGGVRIKMYAPSTWSGGSSYSHLDYATFNDTLNELMVFAFSSGESVHDPGPVTEGLLKDLGWQLAAVDQGLFYPYVNFLVGSWPEAVAIGDVNGDGRNDVVMTTSYYFDPENDYYIFVFLQNSSGELQPSIKYPTNFTGDPTSIDIGDVNHDGRADVVVGNSGSNIQVFLENASGGLDPGTPYSTVNSNNIKIGDLNHDGLLDVVGIGWGTNTADVFLQNSDGTLSPPVTYSVNHGGYDEVDIGDANNDGLQDIIVMSGQLYAYQNIGILFQKTDGTFTAPAYYDLGGNELTQGVAVGDVNGDALQDIVVTSGGNSPNSKIGVFLQNTGGTLNPAVSYQSYDIPEPVVIADVDGDGKKDIVVAHGGWGAVGIYLQGSNGMILPEELYSIPYASHYQPQGLAAGDINGDGSNDVVIADNNNGLVVLYNIGTSCTAPSITSQPQSQTIQSGQAATMSVSASGTTPFTYRWYRGSSGNTSTPVGTNSRSYTTPALTQTTSYWVRVTNFCGSANSNTATLTVVPAAPPSPPANVSASDGTCVDRVEVTWATSSRATSYTVYRAPSLATWVKKTVLGTTSDTCFNDTTAIAGRTYYYWVRASNAYGVSSFSAYNAGYRSDGRPPAPTNVSASDGTYVDRVEVTWAASSGATSYTVYRAASLAALAKKTVLGTTSDIFFNDTTAIPGRTYYYWVRASNAYGTSGFSAYNAGKSSDGKPPAPTNVSASDGTYVDRVEVTWASSPDATSYTVYRAPSLATWVKKVVLGTTSGTLFNDTTAIPGRTYYYWVRASNAYGTSTFSAYDAGRR